MMTSDSFQTILLTQLAQVSIVAVFAWLVWHWWAQNRPHLAHAIWALVLIKCLAPPIISSPTSPFSWYQTMDLQPAAQIDPLDVPSGPPGLEPIVIEASLNEPHPLATASTIARQTQFSWQAHRHRFPWYLWVAGSMTGVLFVVVRYVRLMRRIRRLPVVPCAAAELAMQSLMQKLQIRRHVRLIVIEGPIGPAVLGILRPTILIPSIITHGKTAEELEPLIAHELIHVRRGDLWWSWLQSIANSLWWFHPLVWFSGRMLTREAERSCDDEVVSSLGCAPSLYARSLLDVLEKKSRLRAAPALPGVRPIDVTSKRIERIMELGQGSHARNPRWIRFFMLIAAICILPGARLIAQNSSSTSKSTPTPPNEQASSAANNQTENDSQYTVCSYAVEDLLKAIREEGLSAEQAERALLNLLPVSAVAQTEVRTDKADKEAQQHVTPAPAKPGPAAVLKEDKTKRVLSDGRLMIETTARTHQVIRDTLQHHRKNGFDQVLVKIVVLDVRQDKVAALTAANRVEGVIPRDDAKVVQDSGIPVGAGVFTPPINADEIDRWVRDLQDQGITTVLSCPTILTHNGQAASVHVGTSVPIPVTEDGAPENSVAEVKETGLKSSVLPRLVDDNLVQLEIEVELIEEKKELGIQSTRTNSEGKTVKFKVPGFSQKCLKTKIQSKLDAPVLIGGLAHEDWEDDEQTVRQLMVLLSCKKVSRFAQRKQVQPAVDPAPAATDGATKTPGDAKPSPNANRFVISNGKSELSISGEVSTETTGR